MTDPRLYQIAMLASLLAYGMIRLDFDITAARAVLILATALATQAVCDRLAAHRAGPGRHAPVVNVTSALISGLSLCLLLRTNRPGLAVLAAVVAIAGKLLLRYRGKHILNSPNGGLVAAVRLTG